VGFAAQTLIFLAMVAAFFYVIFFLAYPITTGVWTLLVLAVPCVWLWWPETAGWLLLAELLGAAIWAGAAERRRQRHWRREEEEREKPRREREERLRQENEAWEEAERRRREKEREYWALWRESWDQADRMEAEARAKN
jgi:hypothetical protein